MSDDIVTPPWNTAPNTVEEMLNTAMLLIAWEGENKRKAPLSWCPILTTRLIGDLTHRLRVLEKTVFGG